MGTVEAHVCIENSNPQEAYDAILDASVAQFWMPFPFIIEPGVGGFWAFRSDEWDEPATGTIEVMQPGSLLRLRFHGAMTGQATITLGARPGGVLAAVRHEGAADEEACAAVWKRSLERLKEYLESLTP